MESEREARAAEKAKLLNTETKLLAAELSKSEAISEAGSYKEMLQHQFTEQISEFKVSKKSVIANGLAIQSCIQKGTSTAICTYNCCNGGKTAQAYGNMQNYES